MALFLETSQCLSMINSEEMSDHAYSRFYPKMHTCTHKFLEAAENLRLDYPRKVRHSPTAASLPKVKR